ncbi:MAG: alpha/beta hydrolase [Alphaproteobacteria bacterium]|nr:alpha/beta hydrolase [Alphaproteobacteria bacterium]
MMISGDDTERTTWLGAAFRMMTWPVVIGIGGYGAVVASMFAMQRQLMYVPHPLMTSPQNAGVPEMREIRLRTDDNLDLVNWYRPAEDGKPTVLYCHGNAGNVSTRAFKARPFLDQGFGVILVGYRGYGTNPGKPSEEGLNTDAKTALRYLQQQGVPLSRTVFYGESLGSGVAVHLASEHNPAALILEAAFTSTVDVASNTYWFVPVTHLMLDRFESVARIRNVAAPIFLLHGETDAVVPVELGRRLFDAAPEPKEAAYFPRAGHTDLYQHGAIPKILDFIARHVP